MQKETKKTEKLASALYLLTGFFNDLEPMKWRLRDLAGKMVEKGPSPSTVNEIIGLLNVSKNAGLISDMNHEIVNREFVHLLNQGQDIIKSLGHGDASTLVPVSPTFISSSTTKEVQEKKVEHSPNQPQRQEILPPIKDRYFKSERTHSDLRDGAVALKKNSRQTVILSLLKKKGEIMIKDVSPLIEGVSEKTIQRELLALVKDGILRKEGEKRWSKYYLAN